MNLLIFNVVQCFIPNSYLAPVTFPILVGIGRRISSPVEPRIWRYHTFSKYLSVWARVLHRDHHKTKHRSRLIPKDDMRVFLSTTVPRITDIMRGKQAQSSHRVTERLKLFVIFQQKNNLNMDFYFFFQTFCHLIQWYAGSHKTVPTEGKISFFILLKSKWYKKQRTTLLGNPSTNNLSHLHMTSYC